MNEQSWCDELQAAYLEKVLQVSPNFVATPAGFGGQKRGPEGPRKARRTRVGKGRTLGSYDEEITALQREIDALSAPKPRQASSKTWLPSRLRRLKHLGVAGLVLPALRVRSLGGLLDGGIRG